MITVTLAWVTCLLRCDTMVPGSRTSFHTLVTYVLQYSKYRKYWTCSLRTTHFFAYLSIDKNPVWKICDSSSWQFGCLLFKYSIQDIPNPWVPKTLCLTTLCPDPLSHPIPSMDLMQTAPASVRHAVSTDRTRIRVRRTGRASAAPITPAPIQMWTHFRTTPNSLSTHDYQSRSSWSERSTTSSRLLQEKYCPRLETHLLSHPHRIKLKTHLWSHQPLWDSLPTYNIAIA